jgi:hypothetical protein
MLFLKRILDCVLKCGSAKNWTRSSKYIQALLQHFPPQD